MADIAIVRGAASYHGRAFAGIINKYDEEAYRRKKWPAYPTALAGRAHVSHVWNADRGAAEELAATANIGIVADAPEDIIGQVDGVIVADDGTFTHQRAALPFLEAGVPTFIDKPFSPDVDEARRIVELADRIGAPFFSCSALRFASEIADRRALTDQVGQITAICAVGVNELIYYGVHPLEAIVALMGAGIESVANVGRPGEAVVRLRFRDGRQAVMLVYEKGFSYTLELSVHGTKGHRHIPFLDSAGFYTNMLSAFLDMVETGEPPFPAEETIEIIGALVLAKQSAAEGGVEKRL